MPFHNTFPLATALFCALSSGASADPPQPNIPPFPLLAPGEVAVMALWTQFVAGDDLGDFNTRIEVRFVLTGDTDTDCAPVVIDQTGASQLTPHKRTTMTGGEGGDQYTVTVCAAELDSDATLATLRDASGAPMSVYPDNAVAAVPGPAVLGAASGDPDRITGIAIGDSGCRGDTQNCQFDWPLKELAQAAADTKPDFVLHVGDYHYFYEGDYSFWHEKGGKDRFGYWLQEILIPAGPLLRSAPWIFGRGNHEGCTGQWVGNAWHALFDPADMAHENVSCAERIPATWAVDLAPRRGSAPSFRFFIIDSAQGGRRNAQGYLDAANAHAPANGSQVGWISHYPPLKLAYYNQWYYNEDDIYDDIQAAMGEAVSPCRTDKPCMPSAVFGGHQHFYQEFEFADAGQPLIMIVGHGGVHIGNQQMPGFNDYSISTRCLGDFAKHSPFRHAQKELNATVRTAQVYGFLHLSRDGNTQDPSGWTRTYHWVDNSPPVKFDDIKDCPEN